MLVDGGWENVDDGDPRRRQQGRGRAHRRARSAADRRRREPLEIGVELLFTVSEETGLHGAKAFDVGAAAERFGYVFDHASPFGEIVVASPTQCRIMAEIARPRSARRGLRPEHGRNAIGAAARAIAAMPQGRVDPETTANVGTIAGGTAPNVVP